MALAPDFQNNLEHNYALDKPVHYSSGNRLEVVLVDQDISFQRVERTFRLCQSKVGCVSYNGQFVARDVTVYTLDGQIVGSQYDLLAYSLADFTG